MIEAERRKRDGIRRTSRTHSPLTTRILAAICRRKTGEEFTSEDIRKRVKHVDPTASPNVWGAAFNIARHRGDIQQVNFCRGKRPESHARVLMVWRRA